MTARATCFIEDAGNDQQIEDILDKEIELTRRLMIKNITEKDSRKKEKERQQENDNEILQEQSKWSITTQNMETWKTTADDNNNEAIDKHGRITK